MFFLIQESKPVKMIHKRSVCLPNSEYSELPVSSKTKSFTFSTVCIAGEVFSELSPAFSTGNNYEWACLLLTFQAGK